MRTLPRANKQNSYVCTEPADWINAMRSSHGYKSVVGCHGDYTPDETEVSHKSCMVNMQIHIKKLSNVFIIFQGFVSLNSS